MKNPYNALGVHKDASSATIKQAYRKLAQKHHPDRGGDIEDFQEIQAAYELLIDEDSRAYYDRVGAAPQRGPNKETMALELVATFFSHWLNAVIDGRVLPNSDAINFVRTEITKSLSEGKRTNRELKSQKNKLEIMANRFTPLSPDNNYFNDHVQDLLGKVAGAIASNGLQIEAHGHAIELLRNASYSPEGGIAVERQYRYVTETTYGTGM